MRTEEKAIQGHSHKFHVRMMSLLLTVVILLVIAYLISLIIGPKYPVSTVGPDERQKMIIENFLKERGPTYTDSQRDSIIDNLSSDGGPDFTDAERQDIINNFLKSEN